MYTFRVNRKEVLTALDVLSAFKTNRYKHNPLLKRVQLSGFKGAGIDIMSLGCEGGIASAKCAAIFPESIPAFTTDRNKLRLILKQMKDDEVMFVVHEDTQTLVITSPFVRMQIAIHIGSVFSIQDTKYPVRLPITHEQLSKYIQHGARFMADDCLRPVLNAMHLYGQDGEMGCVTTDAQCLYWSKESNTPNNAEWRLNIQREDIAMLQAMLKTSNKILIEAEPITGRIDILIGRFILKTKSVNGNYPDFRRVIPQASHSCATVDRRGLIEVAALASVTANNATHLLRCAFMDDEIEITTKNTDYSEEGSVSIKSKLIGPHITIGCKADHLLKALNAITREKVDVSMTDSLKALVFTPAEKGKDDYLVLLMPMMLTE